MRWWQTLRQFFLRLFASPPVLIRARSVTELPETLVANQLYIVGEAGWQWYVALLCPCGCNKTLYLNLLPEQHPSWKVNVQADGTVSLFPSVWRKIGCQSHFWLKQGKVEWVKEERGQG